MDRREFLVGGGGLLLVGASSAYVARLLTTEYASGARGGDAASSRRYGMVIDLDKCNNCDECSAEHSACVDACREENNVASFGDRKYPEWDIHWIRKVTIAPKDGSEMDAETAAGEDAETSSKSVILLCNHCDKPPCAQVCPVQATYKRDDGIVIVDHHRCIGCRYCMIACPYNARWFNFQDDEDWPNKDQPKRSHGVAEACTLCAHRLDVGGTPACVEACAKAGAGALVVGDLNDPDSEIATLIANNAVKRIREDLGTEPKVHYIGL